MTKKTEKKVEKLPSKVKWMQRFFKVAGEIAPASVLPIMVKILFTPSKRKLRPPHEALLAQAEKGILKTHEFQAPDKKLKVAYYTWGQGDKTVILVHGWDAKALDYYKLIPILLEQGYKVIAFDGPAHGQSEGESTHLMHFRYVIEDLIKKVGEPYAIVGHSMGGGAACYLLMESNLQIKRLALLAIPIVSQRYFEGMFNFMKVPTKMQKLFFKGFKERLGVGIEHYNLITRPEVIKAEEILFMFDPNDEVISLKDNKEFLNARPSIKSLEIKDSGHNGILKDKRMFDALVEFLR
ncbi:MAG: alpha/beta fold hydrolase [Bacteroidetes bacterium]|nr:alpha/beta fold hydrolase [Bacteroidota bacterium]